MDHFAMHQLYRFYKNKSFDGVCPQCSKKQFRSYLKTTDKERGNLFLGILKANQQKKKKF